MHDGSCQTGLAASGTSHEPERPSSREIQRHPIHSHDAVSTGGRLEYDPRVFNLKQRIGIGSCRGIRHVSARYATAPSRFESNEVDEH